MNDDDRLILFYATSCASCSRFKPTVEYVEQVTGIEVGGVDIDEFPEAADLLNVTMIPTVILVDAGGVEKDRLEGEKTVTDLLEMIHPV